MMKNIKIAVLLALGLAGISAVQASTTDLLLGFNDAAGPAAAKNDYVIDLGLTGSGLVAAANSSGGTYDLSSLFVPATFNTAFSGDNTALNDVAAGVVGGITGAANPKYLYETILTGNTPPSVTSGQFVASANSAQSPATGEYASSSSAGWSSFVAVSPTTSGTLPSGSDVADESGNPLGQLNDGSVLLELWQNTRTTTGLQGTVNGWVDEGTFNINVGGDSVTFTASPVPEPAGSSLLAAGAGLLFIAFRHQFQRKNV